MIYHVNCQYIFFFFFSVILQMLRNIGLEDLHNFCAKESTVSNFKALWCVPMENGDKGLNSYSDTIFIILLV